MMARLYDAKWRAARKAFLRDHPWCHLCAQQGRRTRATIVDHRAPHRGDLALFWDRGNWDPMCKPCHDGAKQSLERSGYLRGHDASGLPLDAGHHWRE